MAYDEFTAKLVAEIAKLKAEVERLRAALQKIVEIRSYRKAEAGELFEIARATLILPLKTEEV